MSDLKSIFVDERGKGDLEDMLVSANELGLFFWGRGGKKFVIDVKRIYFNNDLGSIKEWISIAKYIKDDEERESTNIFILNARDFLDCLACLGEDKVKQLIKELK